MRVEEIVECLNEHIENKRKELGIKTTGHLILQKKATISPIIKAYKKFKYTIWFTKNYNKCVVIEARETARVIDNKDEVISKRVEAELCRQIFNWIGSESYNQVIQGETQWVY